LLRDGTASKFIGPWESGDWIKPLGAPGRKKMQDWFTDHHISADEKPFVPLLRDSADRHHILAVIPYCIDNSVRVTKKTRRILRVK
jgi:tRNA(Ile)-lysidine synthase